MPILALNRPSRSHTTVAPSRGFSDELENNTQISPLPLLDTALLEAGDGSSRTARAAQHDVAGGPPDVHGRALAKWRGALRTVHACGSPGSIWIQQHYFQWRRGHGQRRDD